MARSNRYPAPVRNAILRALYDNGPSTSKQVKTSTAYLIHLEREGLVTRRAQVRTGQRGRPAILWAASDKARKRTKRQVEKEVVAA